MPQLAACRDGAYRENPRHIVLNAKLALGNSGTTETVSQSPAGGLLVCAFHPLIEPDWNAVYARTLFGVPVLLD
jgi:hypothetical protein